MTKKKRKRKPAESERFIWTAADGTQNEGSSENAQVFEKSKDFDQWLEELADLYDRAEYPDSAIQASYNKNPSWHTVLRAYGAENDAQAGEWDTVTEKLAGPMRPEWEGIVRDKQVINKYLTTAPTNNPPVPGTPDKGWT